MYQHVSSVYYRWITNDPKMDNKRPPTLPTPGTPVTPAGLSDPARGDHSFLLDPLDDIFESHVRCVSTSWGTSVASRTELSFGAQAAMADALFWQFTGLFRRLACSTLGRRLRVVVLCAYSQPVQAVNASEYDIVLASFGV